MKKLKKIRIVILTLILGLFTIGSFAQHDHGSHGGGGHSEMKKTTSPNGGVVKGAGKYKIEMVANMFLKKDQLRFYIFKGTNLKVILNEGITGTVTITVKGGDPIIQTLQAKGDEFFVAQLPNSASFHAVIEFKIKGKIISAMFMHTGVGEHQASTTYSCPMHPEVTSDSPGKCNKCGMNLTEDSQGGNDGHNHSH